MRGGASRPVGPMLRRDGPMCCPWRSASRPSASRRSCSVCCSPHERSSMSDEVLYELDEGHVATITYNRPSAMNAVNGAMRRGLNDAFSRFRDDEEAWVAIVTGAGRAFCSGGDMRDGAGSIGEFAGTFWEKPTINSFE